MLDVSKALKCSYCGKYIISEEDRHKYDTCSSRCSSRMYYRENKEKISMKRKEKRNV